MEDALPASQLRLTEDALLDMHQECRLSRQALRRQVEHHREAQADAERERTAAAALRQELAALRAGSCAVERVLAEELRLAERERPARDAEVLSSQVERLRSVATDAVESMELARQECEWLHDQLCLAIQLPGGGDDACSGGDVWAGLGEFALVPAGGVEARVDGGGRGGGGSARDGGSLDDFLLVFSRDDSVLEAARADFACAVQRCHAVQVSAVQVAQGSHEPARLPPRTRCSSRPLLSAGRPPPSPRVQQLTSHSPRPQM